MIFSGKKKLLFLLTVVIFTICYSIFDYTVKTNKLLNHSVAEILSESAHNSITDFETEIETRKQILLNFYGANSTGLYMEKEFWKRYFSKIDIIDLSQLSNESYFKQLTDNKYFLSEPFYEAGERNIFFMVVKDNFVLKGMCPVNTFQDTFYSRNFNGEITTYITNSTGKIIFTDENSTALYDQNLFSQYVNSEFDNPNELYYMVTDLENGLDGFVECKYKSVERLINYIPLKINNWYMFSTVPKKIPIAQSQNILSNTYQLLQLILNSVFFFFFYVVYNETRRINEIKETNRKLKVVTENIPGGVQSRLNDEYFTLTYISQGFSKLTGYDHEEMKNFFDNKYASLIYFEDLPLVRKNIANQLKNDRHFQAEYRIIKKNGQIVWVTERGQIVNDLIHSVLIDITELKNVWDELKNNEERYKLIAQESDSIVFEFNIKNGLAYSSDSFKKLFGFDLPSENFAENMINQNLVYGDDTNILLTLLKNLRNGKQSNPTNNEFRIKNKNGELVWCRLSWKLVLDDEKRPLKAVGKIENINDWKNEQEKLQHKAQIDLLTGLYNKITTHKLIDDYLQKNVQEKTCALFAIDIDNFKGVNDNLGHLVGDKVLIDIAQKLQTAFRQSDVIGRFGGDEFVVFLCNIPDFHFAEKKAVEILDKVRAKINNNDKCKISASIGIAFYPNNGENFQQLYKKADDALYKTKKNGKDSYKVCDD